MKPLQNRIAPVLVLLGLLGAIPSPAGAKPNPIQGPRPPARVERPQGAFGVWGRLTEGAYTLDPRQRGALKEEILREAVSRKFLARAGLLEDRAARGVFFDLLRRAEVVGSTRGGAAGLLKLRSEDDAAALRIAVQPAKGMGNLFGLIPRRIAIRHELLHFAREARSLARGKGSLFEKEQRGNLLYNSLVLMPREESIVWWKSLKPQAKPMRISTVNSPPGPWAKAGR
jgi:hypothetical protein